MHDPSFRPRLEGLGSLAEGVDLGGSASSRHGSDRASQAFQSSPVRPCSLGRRPRRRRTERRLASPRQRRNREHAFGLPSRAPTGRAVVIGIGGSHGRLAGFVDCFGIEPARPDRETRRRALAGGRRKGIPLARSLSPGGPRPSAPKAPDLRTPSIASPSGTARPKRSATGPALRGPRRDRAGQPSRSNGKRGAGLGLGGGRRGRHNSHFRRSFSS